MKLKESILKVYWDNHQNELKNIVQDTSNTSIVNLYNEFELWFESETNFQQFDDELNKSFFQIIKELSLSDNEGIRNRLGVYPSVVVLLKDLITGTRYINDLPSNEFEIDQFINFFRIIISLCEHLSKKYSYNLNK